MTAPVEPTNPSELFTPFLPATFTIPEEEDKLHTFLVDTFSNITDVLNDKKIGTYIQSTESFDGEVWRYITPSKIRNGYQIITYIPSYPNAGILTLTASTNPPYPLTNVNNQFVITKLYGTASKPPTTPGTGDYFMFNNQGDSRISFSFSDTTIVITTTTDLRSYSGFIVVEYLRDGF